MPTRSSSGRTKASCAATMAGPRTDDLAGPGVVGARARSGAVVSWLLADHTGVLDPAQLGPLSQCLRLELARRRPASTFVPPRAGLVTTGADSALVSLLDRAAWSPLKDQPPFRPDGIARGGTVAGTTVWTSNCGQAGQPRLPTPSCICAPN